MLKVNEYFDGKVKSIGLANAEGNSTVGVISKGEYEFGTSTVEIMVIVSGQMQVNYNGSEWLTYKKNQQFTVQANSKFKVKTDEDCAYLCYYK